MKKEGAALPAIVREVEPVAGKLTAPETDCKKLRPLSTEMERPVVERPLRVMERVNLLEDTADTLGALALTVESDSQPRESAPVPRTPNLFDWSATPMPLPESVTETAPEAGTLNPFVAKSTDTAFAETDRVSVLAFPLAVRARPPLPIVGPDNRAGRPVREENEFQRVDSAPVPSPMRSPIVFSPCRGSDMPLRVMNVDPESGMFAPKEARSTTAESAVTAALSVAAEGTENKVDGLTVA